jgi:hypothetical protein
MVMSSWYMEPIVDFFLGMDLSRDLGVSRAARWRRVGEVGLLARPPDEFFFRGASCIL